MGLSLAKSFAAALLRACKSMASTAGGMNTCEWLGGDPRVALRVKNTCWHLVRWHLRLPCFDFRLGVYRDISSRHWSIPLRECPFFRPDERMDGASFRGKPMGWHWGFDFELQKYRTHWAQEHLRQLPGGMTARLSEVKGKVILDHYFISEDKYVFSMNQNEASPSYIPNGFGAYHVFSCPLW